MVAVCRDGCRSRLPAAHAPPIRQLLHLGADGVKPRDHGGDPVGLLDAQLVRVTDLGGLGDRGHRDRDERQLVDEARDLAAADRDRPQRPPAAH
jgi:hypothetical protein